jgi:signal transduction histidine kinase
VDVLAQSTVESFVALYTQTITDQRERLEQFTRMAAHEWRQPLGALQFGVKLLKVEGLDQARTHRTLEIVERSVDQLVALTQKLETVARMNDAGDNPVDQEVSVATVANEAARQVREMADARSVEIRVGDTLPTLTVDVGRLELVLVNLLSNGIKYSDAAKPERYVEITGGDTGDDLCRIMVSDNGVGIPAASLHTIFHRFTRAHDDRADLKHVGGMGLGLSIVEDSVQAMHGHIEVVSTEGVGTTFVLTLPVTRRNAS